MEPQKWGIYQGKPKLETVNIYTRNLDEVLNGSWLMLTPTSTTFVFDADVNSGGQFKACCKRLELKVTQVNSFLECLLSKAGLLLVLFVCLFVNSTFSHNSKLKNNNRALVFFFFFFLSFLFFFVVL